VPALIHPEHRSAAPRPTESTPGRFAATPARGGHKSPGPKRSRRGALSSADGAESCADEDVGAPRAPVPRGRGESALADLGVEFFRLDFGLWFAAHSIPSQRGGYPTGRPGGD
jgi:hypothetical protein